MIDVASVDIGATSENVLEMYVPESKRAFGYYTCPFLLGDTLAARSDLKADRDRRTLVVQSAFLERGQDPRSVLVNFVDELRELQAWLGLAHIELAERGDLLTKLRRNARAFGLEIAKA